MSTELIIFSAILVVSVIVHFFFWRDSKKRYSEYMSQVEALNKKLNQLEANDVAIDKLLDDADERGQKMDEEIKALRSVWFMNGKRESIDN